MADLDQVDQELGALAAAQPGAFRIWGVDGEAVSVTLRADQGTLAALLLDRFGDSIRMTVGSEPYPRSRTLTAREAEKRYNRSHRPEPTVLSVPGLLLNLILPPDPLNGTKTLWCDLGLRNAGTARIEFTTQEPVFGKWTDVLSGHPFRGVSGPYRGTGRHVVLDPGEFTTIRTAVASNQASDNDGDLTNRGEPTAARSRYGILVVLPITYLFDEPQTNCVLRYLHSFDMIDEA